MVSDTDNDRRTIFPSVESADVIRLLARYGTGIRRNPRRYKREKFALKRDNLLGSYEERGLLKANTQSVC